MAIRWLSCGFGAWWSSNYYFLDKPSRNPGWELEINRTLRKKIIFTFTLCQRFSNCRNETLTLRNTKIQNLPNLSLRLPQNVLSHIVFCIFCLDDIYFAIFFFTPMYEHSGVSFSKLCNIWFPIFEYKYLINLRAEPGLALKC